MLFIHILFSDRDVNRNEDYFSTVIPARLTGKQSSVIFLSQKYQRNIFFSFDLARLQSNLKYLATGTSEYKLMEIIFFISIDLGRETSKDK
jgi:hypothetical protein